MNGRRGLVNLYCKGKIFLGIGGEELTESHFHLYISKLLFLPDKQVILITCVLRLRISFHVSGTNIGKWYDTDRVSTTLRCKKFLSKRCKSGLQQDPQFGSCSGQGSGLVRGPWQHPRLHQGHKSRVPTDPWIGHHYACPLGSPLLHWAMGHSSNPTQQNLEGI